MGTKGSQYMLRINNPPHRFYSHANAIMAALIEFKFQTQENRSPAFLPPQQTSTCILVSLQAWQERKPPECFYLCNQRVGVIFTVRQSWSQGLVCHLQAWSMLCDEPLYCATPSAKACWLLQRDPERQRKGKCGSECSQLC